MCKCTPEIKTPFCGRIDCEWPEPGPQSPAPGANLVIISENYAVVPDEVAAVEHYDHYAGGSFSEGPRYEHSGAIVILKNGRKTYLRGVTVKAVTEAIGRQLNELRGRDS